MSIIGTVRQYRLFTLQLAKYEFSPGIISTLVTLIFLYTMISLGLWQLDRSEFKNKLQSQIEQRKSLQTEAIDELPKSMDERRYRPVKFKGEYDKQHSVLLDNITLRGKVGYHVFTPVKISDSKAVLVSRGFVAMGRTRAELPDIQTPKGQIEFAGLLDLPPSRTLVLADNVNQVKNWPVVLQYVDLQEISQILGYELYDMVIWLNKDEAGSLQYDLPVLNLNAAKNNGYAFQWFAMTLALFIIYIVVNTKSIEQK